MGVCFYVRVHRRMEVHVYCVVCTILCISLDSTDLCSVWSDSVLIVGICPSMRYHFIFTTDFLLFLLNWNRVYTFQLTSFVDWARLFAAVYNSALV